MPAPLGRLPRRPGRAGPGRSRGAIRRGALPPPAPGTPAAAQAAVLANIRANSANGALQAVSLNLYGPFVGIDLIRLGAAPWEIGALSALPALATALSSAVGARWLATRRDPQRAGAAAFATARLMLLALAMLNLGVAPGAMPGPWRPAVMILLIGLFNVPSAVGNLSWQAVLTGLLPPGRRAPALAVRGLLASLTGVAIALVAGWWAQGRRNVAGYAWLYAAAAVAGLAEVAAFLRLRGDAAAPTARAALLPAVGRLWRTPQYRAFTLCTLPFYLGWLMAWPLFLTYEVDVAHATNLWMAAFTAVNSLSAALGNLLWRRVGDRIGAPLALPAACVLLAGVPVVFALGPGLPLIFATQVLGGLMGAGVNLFLLVRLMDVAPEGDRVVAMGVANTLQGAVGVAGPMLGVAVARFIPLPRVLWIPAGLRVAGGLALLAAGLAAATPRGGPLRPAPTSAGSPG